MTWFAFKGYPDINATGLEEKELVAAGFHGYATQAEADANPNSVLFGPQSVIIDSLRAGNATNPANLPQHAANIVGSALGGGLNLTVGNTHNLLNRGLKIVFGGILIAAGVVHMLGVDREALGVAKYVIPPARLPSKSYF